MDRQDYIEIILDHYEHPRNKGRMEDADIQLGGGNPGCGDLITMYLKLGEGNRIEHASFEGEGCTISQAGGSIIAEMIEGMTLAHHASPRTAYAGTACSRLCSTPRRGASWSCPVRVTSRHVDYASC